MIRRILFALIAIFIAHSAHGELRLNVCPVHCEDSCIYRVEAQILKELIHSNDRQFVMDSIIFSNPTTMMLGFDLGYPKSHITMGLYLAFEENSTKRKVKEISNAINSLAYNNCEFFASNQYWQSDIPQDSLKTMLNNIYDISNNNIFIEWMYEIARTFYFTGYWRTSMFFMFGQRDKITRLYGYRRLELSASIDNDTIYNSYVRVCDQYGIRAIPRSLDKILLSVTDYTQAEKDLFIEWFEKDLTVRIERYTPSISQEMPFKFSYIEDKTPLVNWMTSFYKD